MFSFHQLLAMFCSWCISHWFASFISDSICYRLHDRFFVSCL